MKTAMHSDAKGFLFEFAFRHREEPTVTEAQIWEALRRKKGSTNKYKFRRQHPIDRYILDFYCHAKRLAIEIDGGYHFTPEQKAYDEHRTEVLNQLGIRVIRFTNEEVLGDLEGVLKAIGRALEEG